MESSIYSFDGIKNFARKASFSHHFGFSVSLILGLVILWKAFPLAIDKTVYYCKQALNHVSLSIPHEFSIVVIVSIIFLLSLGLFSFFIQLYQTHLYTNNLLAKRAKLPSKLLETISGLDISNRLDLIDSKSLLSFCYGIVRPRICVSSGLIEALSKQELIAVLLHEKYHMKSFDPLKILLSRSLSISFFFLPILSDLEYRYFLSKELSSDYFVFKEMGEVRYLKSALAKVLLSPMLSIEGLISFADKPTLEERIQILTGKQELKYPTPPFINVALSLSILLLSLILLKAPVYSTANASGNHSYVVCSQGKDCVTSCYEEKNYTKNILYTPLNQN